MLITIRIELFERIIKLYNSGIHRNSKILQSANTQVIANVDCGTLPLCCLGKM